MFKTCAQRVYNFFELISYLKIELHLKNVNNLEIFSTKIVVRRVFFSKNNKGFLPLNSQNPHSTKIHLPNILPIAQLLCSLVLFIVRRPTRTRHHHSLFQPPLYLLIIGISHRRLIIFETTKTTSLPDITKPRKFTHSNN